MNTYHDPESNIELPERNETYPTLMSRGWVVGRGKAGESKRTDRRRRRLYFYSRSAISRSAAHLETEETPLSLCVCVCTVVTSNIPLNFVIPGGKFGLPNSGIGLFCADTGTLTEILGFLSDWFKTVFMVDSENVRVEFPPEIRIVAFLLAHAIFCPNAHLPPTAPAGMNHAPIT